MSMEDILKTLVSSRQQGGSSNSSDNNQDPMGALVGSLLGGNQSSSQGTSGGNLMGSLVGSLLGGSQQPAGGLGGMMGMLEAVMGSGTGANDPIMALLQPYIAPLAKKANISPEIAMVVVSFVAHKLLAHHPDSGRDSNSFNFEDMFQQIGAGKIDSNMLRSSGMVKELATKTGLDEATAANSLALGFSMVGKGAASLMQKNAAKTPTKTVKETASAGKKVAAKSVTKTGKKTKR